MGNVIVAGSINMDIVVKADRYPRAGETLVGRDVMFFQGGKGANQAIAAARLGASTTLIGRLGTDEFARDLRAILKDHGIDLTHVAESRDTHSGTAIITVVGSENAIIVVPGANGLVNESDVTSPVVSTGDILVSQFEIPEAAIRAFFQRGRELGARTILNAAPAIGFDRSLLKLVDVLILNEIELGSLIGTQLAHTDSADRFIDGARSLQIGSEQVICVTLGRRGAIALADGDAYTIAARAVEAVDTTGAGDCFVGAYAARLATGSADRPAFEYASVAASICVQRMGAGPSMPSQEDVFAATQRSR